MFDIGREIVTALLANPLLIPVYLIGLYLIVIRPVLKKRESRSLESSTLREIADPSADLRAVERAPQATGYVLDLDSFLLFTHKSWAQGHLDTTLGDNPKKIAQEKSVNEFRALFEARLPALEYAFKDFAPGGDEFLIDVYYVPVGTSFVLTNRYFSFFNLDKGLLSMGGEAVRIPLNAIKSCEVYKKMVTYKIEITLKEFEVFEITAPYDLPAAYIQKVLEQQPDNRRSRPE